MTVSTVFLVFKTVNDEECSVFIAPQEHLEKSGALKSFGAYVFAL